MNKSRHVSDSVFSWKKTCFGAVIPKVGRTPHWWGAGKIEWGVGRAVVAMKQCPKLISN